MKNFLFIICTLLPISVLAGDPPFNITQNTDTTTILNEHSVACPNDDDRYMRRFLLSAALNVTDINFAVELASAPITLTVGLYAIDISDPLLLANLSPIGATTVTVSDLDDLQPVSVQLSGNIDGGLNDLVVEVSAPDFTDGTGFFMGANDAGQIGPSFLVAPQCTGPEPTDIGALKFPEVHIIMSVVGTITGSTADIIFADSFDTAIP